MSDSVEVKLPKTWVITSISEVTEVNPKFDKSSLDDDVEVSFVPMPAVEAASGVIDVTTIRKFGDVKKGYTGFLEGDVLFAKITPCMENGKMAVVPALKNNVGFGSTEFHVLRSYRGVSQKYIYYFVASKRVRYDAEHNMAGAVGQKRVTTMYLSGREIPVPPTNEQHRIVTKIETLFSELDKGIESLKTAREQLKVYHQALLKHAFEGKLTAQWREQNRDKLETPEQLLARIKQERQARYQQQLKDWQVAVKVWEKNGKEGKKPGKPSQHKELPPITEDEIALLPVLPSSWGYARLAEISKIGSGMSVSKDRKLSDPVDVAYLRVANVQRGELVLEEIKRMPIEKQALPELALEKWDILFNEGGDRDKLGRGWIWEGQVEPCITQNHVFRSSPYFASEFHSKFISHWGNTFGKDYFEKGGKQTTNLASINKTVLSMFPVPLPSIEEQEMVIRALDDSMSLIGSLEAEVESSIAKCETLRQSILKKAFSGQLVPQDANDEPASALLARIHSERAGRSPVKTRVKE